MILWKVQVLKRTKTCFFFNLLVFKPFFESIHLSSGRRVVQREAAYLKTSFFFCIISPIMVDTDSLYLKMFMFPFFQHEYIFKFASTLEDF